MSTLSVENLQHPSSSNANITLDSNGNINLGAGSASLPSITAQGDTNTGIYFPAADNIGFATGGTIRGRWTDNGLCFGTDTAAANALDDYEEGEWTAVLEGSTSNPSGTYGNQAGRYTKIGRTVFVIFQVLLNSGFSAGSGSIRISGLPFTSNFEVFGGNFCQEFNSNSYVLNHASMHISNNTTYMDMFFNRQNDGFTTYKWADISTGNNMYLYGSLTYQVA
jgi:hypothetical protein